MQNEFLPVYPAIRLDHLERLTDRTGIVQHAVHSVPDLRHGYSIDDQARALIAALGFSRLSGSLRAPHEAYVYMSYLRLAARDEGWFHNFLAHDRAWLDDHGSEDAYGRTMWALGYAQRYSVDPGLAGAAADLFDEQLHLIGQLQWIRARAFSLFGLYHRLQAVPNTRLLAVMETVAETLAASYAETASDGWWWFENQLTYCNAKLPASLLLAHELTGNSRFRQIGLESLQWLFEVVNVADGTLRLVGQDGWYPRGGVKAAFDEQCVDAQNLVEAALIAHRVTGDARWIGYARMAFDWFFGRNVHKVSLLDTRTWGCYDGLTPNRVNRNMGAESIICYLLAYLGLVDAGVMTLEGTVVAAE